MENNAMNNSSSFNVPLFCANCGNSLRPGIKYCGHCGQKVDEDYIKASLSAHTAPAFAEQPAAPAFAEQPAAPAFAEQSAAPAFAEQPSAPAFAEQPAAPAFAEQPSAPAFAEQSAAPAFAEQPSAPAFAEQPAAPAINSAMVNESAFEQEQLVEEDEPVSVFADGLPEWDIVPPHIMVRRKK